MKKSDFKDELLFNYFEGNLDEYSERNVKSLSDQDAEWKTSMFFWGESYRVADSDAEVLSFDYSRLVQKEKRPTPRLLWIGLSVLLLSVTSVSLYLLLNKESSNTLSHPKIVSVENTSDAAKQVLEHKQQFENRIVSKKTKRTQPSKIVETSIPIPVLVKESRTEKSLTQQDVVEVSATDSAAVDLKPATAGRVESTALTRSQKRALEKTKKKWIEKRKQEEFLKGKEPYVIPLDDKNF